MQLLSLRSLSGKQRRDLLLSFVSSLNIVHKISMILIIDSLAHSKNQ